MPFPDLSPSFPSAPLWLCYVQGTDGPWVGNFASALCGSPNIYIAEPGEQDW